MDYLEKVKDVLNYYGVDSGVRSVFGNWAVTNDGDLVNIIHMYPIYSHALSRVDVGFRLNLMDKDWFDAEESIMFDLAYKKAILVACERGTDNTSNQIPALDQLP